MCGVWPDQMLDELYGLLEPVESAALAAHLASCPACADAMVQAQADYGLLAKASKESFPNVTFRKPVEPSTVVAQQTRTARSVWVNWVVAASVFFVVSGTLIPAMWTMGTYVTARNRLSTGQSELVKSTAETKEIRAELESVVGNAQTAVDTARKNHDQVVTEWVSAEKAAGQPFAVTVRGPAAAIPGAPNVYGIAAVDGNDRPVAAKIEATIRGSGGEIYFNRQFETANGRGANLTIPATVWMKSKRNETLSLSIKAVNHLTNQTSELSEPIAILTASYATVLSTDAPIYRPGDQIAFRSLTLDRTNFQPPERDLSLAFCLVDSRGAIVTVGNDKRELMLIGSTKLESADSGLYRPLLGSDGKPVKGVGCGELRIPPSVPAGQFKLCVYELPIGTKRPAANAIPLATRPILIQPFETHRFAKTLTFDKSSYGPGEVVTVTLTVTEQGRPISGRQLMVSATADGQPIIDLTDTKLIDGKTTIRFTLPKTVTQASVSVAVLDGVHETIVRPVPLVTKQVKIDFFPEGGDLIAGVLNRIYIRGTRLDDQPADFEGTIQDGESIIATVKSTTDPDQPGANRGIGIASFTPQAGKSYTFRTVRPIAQTSNLPIVKTDGVAMAIPTGVFRPDQPIVVMLASTANRKLVVGAYARGTPIAHAAIEVEANKPTTVTLTADAKAPGGVTRITVFEEPDFNQPGRKDLKPVAERLVFRAHPQKLNLDVTVDTNEAGGVDTKSFRPGENLRIKVNATTEAKQPTAAILFTSVATETIYSSADDLTDRALPTHFLLNGEIEHPDSLERADFLLSGHPQAAVALDALLSTQGWRRFAEQNPANFRKTAKPDDADRLLVAVGSKTPISDDYKPAVERVMRSYQSKYDAAWEGLANAERSREALRMGSPIATAYHKAAERTQNLNKQWNSDLAELRVTIQDDASQLINRLTLVAVLGLLLVMVGIRLSMARSWPERGVLTKGIALIAGLIVLHIGVERFVVSRISTINLVPMDPVVNGPTIEEPTTGIEIPNSGLESFGPPISPIRIISAATAMDRLNGRPIVLTQDAIDLGTRAFGDQIPTKDESESRIEQRRKLLESAGSKTITAAATANAPCIVREYSTINLSKRTNVFTEVLYWHPAIVVPGDGESPWMPFSLNDAVASYRVTVAGHTLDGRLGQSTTRIRVQKPLEAAAKMPLEIGLGDRVDLIATARQHADFETVMPRMYIRGWNLTVQTTNDLEKEYVGIDETTHVGRRTVRITPVDPGSARVTVFVADAESIHGDQVAKSISVVPYGEKIEGVVNGVVNGKRTFRLSTPPDLKFPKLVIRTIPDPLTELEGSIGAMARQPSACFEQSAANLYPDLLMIPWLESNRAAFHRDSLPGSFRKMLNFECDAGPKRKAGFDWFGGSASPHESLTAYGLLLFSDINHIAPIDDDVITRTKQFLLDRRDGQGGYRLNGNAQDQFGRAPQSVANAYITYALRQSDASLDLSTETKAVTAEAIRSADPYRLALAAMSTKDNKKILELLASKQAEDGSLPGSQTSITNSGGPDLITESTALAVLAWQKSGHSPSNVQKAIRYLMNRRQPNGGFGATQATILTLKAFNTFRRELAIKPTDHYSVSVERARVRTYSLDEPFAQEYLMLPTEVTIESTVVGDLPISISWEGYLEPKPVRHAKLDFDANLTKSELHEGETTTLTVQVTNRDSASSGMIVAKVGLPAGLMVPTDAKQLNDLTRRASAGEAWPAFWEMKDRELILYYRNLTANQSSTARIELIAEYPGEYTGPISQAQRAYDASIRSVLSPLKVHIEPRE